MADGPVKMKKSLKFYKETFTVDLIYLLAAVCAIEEEKQMKIESN